MRDGEVFLAAVIDGQFRLTLDGQVVFDSIAVGGKPARPVSPKPVRLQKGKPIVYQDVDGERKNIDGRFVIDDYQISYLGVGRDVLRFGAASTGPSVTTASKEPRRACEPNKTDVRFS